MPEATAISADYDRDGDVLYVICGEREARRAEQDDFGILWRYGDRGEVVGATILDAADTWREHKAGIERAMARSFRISADEAGAMVDRALRDGT